MLTIYIANIMLNCMLIGVLFTYYLVFFPHQPNPLFIGSSFLFYIKVSFLGFMARDSYSSRFLYSVSIECLSKNREQEG